MLGWSAARGAKAAPGFCQRSAPTARRSRVATRLAHGTVEPMIRTLIAALDANFPPSFTIMGLLAAGVAV
jgi:hypothetical protein